MSDVPMLVGCAAQEARFIEAMSGPRPHHAWLLHGPEGLGKARFALNAAQWLLGATTILGRLVPEPGDAIAHRVGEGGHGGFLRLARLPDDKGKMPSVISVAMVRRINDFFGMTSGEGGWRVVVVDALDELNTAAANALLKNLEEPPRKTVFLLVCHRRSAILPTILSRTIPLRFNPLSTEDMRVFLAQHEDGADGNLEVVIEHADGRPGRALALLRSGAANWLKEIGALVDGPGGIDGQRWRRFAVQFSKPADEEKRKLMATVLRAMIARKARTGASDAHFWAELYPQVHDRLTRLEAQHLDAATALQEVCWLILQQQRRLAHADR